MRRRSDKNEETFQSASTDSDLTDYAFNSSKSKTLSNPKTPPKNKKTPSKEKTRPSIPTPRFREEASGSGRSLRKSTSREERPLQVNTHRSKRKSDNPRNVKDLKAKKMQREIQLLQKFTGNLIPKLSFSRLIREILREMIPFYQMRVTFAALEALQSTAEVYLTQLFEDSYRCTLHRGRVTLQIKDIHLARYFRGPNDPGNRW